MRKLLWFGTLFLLLLMGCNKAAEILQSNVNIRVKNVSDSAYIKFEMGGYDPSISYSNIAPGALTEYRPLPSGKRPDVFFVTTEQDTLNVVVDYTPEYYNMANGYHTVEVGVGATLEINFTQE